MIPPRTPRYPLKTARTLHSDAEIALARENIARYPAARKLADTWRRAADAWLKWDDADLARLVTPASVPRAFDVGASVGCPKCGQTIHEKFGTYPWRVDLRKPFRLTCPVDGSVYPDNDYAAYLESGFKDRGGWDRLSVVDDGWGWLNPANNERYWFVAHWNHAVWHRHIGPAVPALGRAYLLTGDRRYAHKAAVLLHRIAEVYPAMDHEKQSRYGLLSAARGIRYPGKVLNYIWETALVTEFTQGYDAVWETIDGDTELHRQIGKSGADIRAFIEANLLEDAVDGYFSGRILGNFGMHQNTLAHLAVVRQHGETEKWISSLMDGKGAPGDTPSYQGLRYALYNLVSRDGVPGESAPGYNFLWLSKLTDLASLLKKGGQDLFADEARLRRMYDAVLDQVNAGVFTPSWGDSGNVWGDTGTGRSPEVFLTAAREYGDDRYARFVSPAGASAKTDAAFPTFSTLFLPPASTKGGSGARSAAKTATPRRSRLLDDAGLGILCDPQDKNSVLLTYGWKAGHGHFDRLNFELFAAGVPLMPDLGYPDAMNDYVSGIYTWSKNTVAHNTVVVDARRQLENVAGVVKLFAQSPTARILDVDAAGTYPQATTYRRALLMVDAGKGQSYLLDVFDVAGGAQHDYSLHGPPGQCAPEGPAEWGKPQTGTLAGPDVAPGQIYDDAQLSAPGYKGGFSRYTGSGFQHLTDVRRKGQGDEWFVQWQHEKKPEARLRVRILPQEDQQILHASARVSPVKQPEKIGYLIARRAGKDGLKSRFVSIIEPFAEKPFIEAVRAVPLASGSSGVAVEVRRVGGETDLLIYDPDGSEKRIGGDASGAIITDAHAAVVTRGRDGRIRRVFLAGGPEGCTLKADGRDWKASGVSGEVVAIDPARRTVRIRTGSGGGAPPTAGTVFSLVRGRRRAAYTIAQAQHNTSEGILTLTTVEDLWNGRAPVKAVDGTKITAGVALPRAATYAGAAVYADGSAEPLGFVAEAAGAGAITLENPPSAPAPNPGTDVWLAHAAPGDRMEIPAVLDWKS